MCGLVGVFKKRKSNIYERDKEIFLELLHVGLVRGHHGTGIYTVKEDGASKYIKAGGPPYHLMIDEKFKKYWSEYVDNRSVALIGHNRLATTGEKTQKHAHPFTVDHITMVHNGTLFPGKLPDFTKFPVDSMALCNAIATMGIKDAIKATYGAYAIIYWNSQDKTINFLRNAERPLWIATDKLTDRITVASERKMLEWILDRKTALTADVKIMELPINEHYSWKIGADEPEITKMNGYSYTTTPTNTADTYGGHHSAWSGLPKKIWDPVAKVYVFPEQLSQKKLDLDLSGGTPIDSEEAATAFLESIGQKPVGPEKPAAALLTPRSGDNGKPKDPRLKAVFINTKDYTKHDGISVSDRQTKKEEIYKAGDSIDVFVNEFILEKESPADPSQSRYVVVGSSDKFPNVRFQFFVTGDNEIDSIFEACIVSVKLKNVWIPKEGAKDDDTIIWANEHRIKPSCDLTHILH